MRRGRSGACDSSSVHAHRRDHARVRHDDARRGGVSGGGSSGSGGFGLIIAPALTVNLVSGQRARVGLIVKPDLWILYDTESERPLVYAGFTTGVSLVLH